MPNGNPKNSVQSHSFDESRHVSRTNRLHTGLTMTLRLVEQNVVNIVLKLAVYGLNFCDFIGEPL